MGDELFGMMVIVGTLRTNSAYTKRLTISYTFLLCSGWQLLLCRYWWVSVGFVCKSVINRPFSTVIFTSRNVTDLPDHSAVNFIVGWNWLIFSINCPRCSSPCGHSAKISSMYRHQTNGVNTQLSRKRVSRLLMKRFAYEKGSQGSHTKKVRIRKDR